MRKIIVGIGSYTASDDAIGLHLVNYLATQNLPVDCELVTLNQDTSSILNYFEEDVDNIIIIDCTKMRMMPGASRFFAIENIDNLKTNQNFSTHEGDLFKVIELGKSLGLCVPKITIFGIEPRSTSFGFDLSNEIKDAIPNYARQIVERFL